MVAASLTWDQTADCVGPPTAAGAAPAPRLLQGKLPALAHSIEGEKQEIVNLNLNFINLSENVDDIL